MGGFAARRAAPRPGRRGGRPPDGHTAHVVDAVAFGGEISYFGVPDELVHPLPMRLVLGRSLTLRSGVTLERRRVLAQAEQYPCDHPELAECYVSHVFPVDDAQSAYEHAVPCSRTGRGRRRGDVTTAAPLPKAAFGAPDVPERQRPASSGVDLRLATSRGACRRGPRRRWIRRTAVTLTWRGVGQVDDVEAPEAAEAGDLHGTHGRG